MLVYKGYISKRRHTIEYTEIAGLMYLDSQMWKIIMMRDAKNTYGFKIK